MLDIDTCLILSILHQKMSSIKILIHKKSNTQSAIKRLSFYFEQMVHVCRSWGGHHIGLMQDHRLH